MARPLSGLLVLAALVASASAARFLTSTPPPPSTPACLTSCLASSCDFLFAGVTGVPTFPLNAINATQRPDYKLGRLPPAGTAIVARNKTRYPSSKWTTIVLNTDSSQVQVQTKVNNTCSAFNQFYLNSDNGVPFVRARTFQTNLNISQFAPNCIRVPVTNAQLSNGSLTINLNNNDGNTLFPQAKRCVIFRISRA